MGEACINQRVESVSESPLLLLTYSIMNEEESTFHRDQHMPEEMILNLVSANGPGRAEVEQEKDESLASGMREGQRQKMAKKEAGRERKGKGGRGSGEEANAIPI